MSEAIIPRTAIERRTNSSLLIIAAKGWHLPSPKKTENLIHDCLRETTVAWRESNDEPSKNTASLECGFECGHLIVVVVCIRGDTSRESHITSPIDVECGGNRGVVFAVVFASGLVDRTPTFSWPRLGTNPVFVDPVDTYHLGSCYRSRAISHLVSSVPPAI